MPADLNMVADWFDDAPFPQCFGRMGRWNTDFTEPECGCAVTLVLWQAGLLDPEVYRPMPDQTHFFIDDHDIGKHEVDDNVPMPTVALDTWLAGSGITSGTLLGFNDQQFLPFKTIAGHLRFIAKHEAAHRRIAKHEGETT